MEAQSRRRIWSESTTVAVGHLRIRVSGGVFVVKVQTNMEMNGTPVLAGQKSVPNNSHSLSAKLGPHHVRSASHGTPTGGRRPLNHAAKAARLAEAMQAQQHSFDEEDEGEVQFSPIPRQRSTPTPIIARDHSPAKVGEKKHSITWFVSYIQSLGHVGLRSFH